MHQHARSMLIDILCRLSGLVSRAGFEPALPSFSDSCLLPLGYRDMFVCRAGVEPAHQGSQPQVEIRSTTHGTPTRSSTSVSWSVAMRSLH